MSSIQFRSRIKPAFNYSDTLNSYGVCCGATGATGATIKSFIECFNEYGHFIPVPDGNFDSVSCPDPDTRLGCCCACSYLSSAQRTNIPTLTTPNGDPVAGSAPYLDAGFRSNISRCACDKIGGKWTEGSCPSTLSDSRDSSNYWKDYCLIGATTDARAPRSCCHLDFDETTGEPTRVVCSDVCSSYDCSNLGTIEYPSIFGSNRCTVPLVEGTTPTSCLTGVNYSLIATSSFVYEGFSMGSCYELVQNGITLEYECSLTPQVLCEGYWVEELDADIPLCSTPYRPSDPVKSGGKYLVQQMGLSAFNAIGITSGDEFQGGIYIGIFKPPYLNGKSSEVYGNLNFQEPKTATLNGDSVGGTDTQWAIIADTKQYFVPFLKNTEKDIDYNTSLWDGYYNIYGGNSFVGIDTALSNTIKYTDRFGFIDYYLPSIYELYFYAAYLKKNNITNIGNLMSSSMFNAKYLNQKSKTKSQGNSFVYGIVVDDNFSVNYRTILVDKRVPATAIFFRRIVLQ